MTLRKLLVLHNLEEGSRNSTVEFALAFMRHAGGFEVHYANIFGIPASNHLHHEYDVAIVTNELLSLRTMPYWPNLEARLVRILAKVKRKVLLPQDDYTFSARLDDLIDLAEIDNIWTPISSDLELLYPKALRRGANFSLALTGYFEQDEHKLYESFSKPFSDRSIDLGQRVRSLPPQFGTLGSRKAYIAEEMARQFKTRGLRVDVSTDEASVLFGQEWLAFLGNTKFTVSRMGGASLADTRHLMAQSLENLKRWIPGLKDEIAARLASKKGVASGNFSAESPRLFESAALGVCQILDEDHYLEGILKPWEHYIPLKFDFSNLEEVFSAVKDGGLVESIIKNSRATMLESQLFTYKSFVLSVLSPEYESGLADAGQRTVFVDLDSEQTSRETLSTLFFTRESATRLRGGDFWSLRNFRSSSRAGFEMILAHEYVPETLVRPWRELSHFVSNFQEDLFAD